MIFWSLSEGKKIRELGGQERKRKEEKGKKERNLWLHGRRILVIICLRLRFGPIECACPLLILLDLVWRLSFLRFVGLVRDRLILHRLIRLRR